MFLTSSFFTQNYFTAVHFQCDINYFPNIYKFLIGTIKTIKIFEKHIAMNDYENHLLALPLLPNMLSLI
jgi:hypothetical protein